jgi:hypothetical protein
MQVVGHLRIPLGGTRYQFDFGFTILDWPITDPVEGGLVASRFSSRARLPSGPADSQNSSLRISTLDSALGETPVKFSVFTENVVGGLLERLLGPCQ